MNRRKRCQICRKLFRPHPQTYPHQKVCSKKPCQRQRKRQAMKRWRLIHPFDEENRLSQREKWRKTHAEYWKQWRAKHGKYVKRNREKQRQRDAQKRENLAKRNVWEQDQREKTMQIRLFRDLAKRNAWVREYTEKTVQNVMIKILAKRTHMAKAVLSMRE